MAGNGNAKKTTLKHKVSSLKIERGKKYSFTATWKTPSDATAAKVKDGKKQVKNEHKWEEIYVTWRINEAKVGSKKEPRDRDVIKKETTTTDSTNIDNFNATSPNESYNRKSFYPVGSKKVDSIVVSVAGHNKKFGTGDKVTESYKFKLPKAPSISVSYNETSQAVTFTVKTDEGAGKAERYDTVVKTAVKIGDGSVRPILGWTSTTKTEWSATYQIADYASLVNYLAGETLEFRCWAYARGFKGANPSKKKAVYKSYTVCAPGTPSIKSVTCDTKGQNGLIRVEVASGGQTKTFQLERRHGESGSWESVEGATENGSISALYDSVGLAQPVPGEYLYYRVVATHDNFTRTSAPFKATKLYTKAATAASQNVGLVSTSPGDDGTSIYAVFGWSGNTPTGSTGGIEVSWATDETAWESNQGPDTYEVTWEDATAQSNNWAHTAGVYIRGLQQGTGYYIRGRRFLDTAGVRTYSDYSAFSTGEGSTDTMVMPVTRPASVSLQGPSFVARGEAIPIYWTFEGDSTQTEYHVFSTANEKAPLVEGYDALGAVSIPATAYGDADAITLYVMVGAGGALTRSNEELTVSITSNPSCEVYVSPTITANSGNNLAGFTVYSDSSQSRLTCVCRADGIGAWGPLGDDRQFAGDSVWSASVTPAWAVVDWSTTALYAQLVSERAAAATAHDAAVAALSGLTPTDAGYGEAVVAEANTLAALNDLDTAIAAHSGNIYAASVYLGAGVPLADTAGYSIEVQAADQQTGLLSGIATAHFNVDWAHQAPTPSPDIEVSTKRSARSVTIRLAAPENAVQTDVYDVYRGSVGGYELIASSKALTDTIIDRYAAFGEQSYRIATRTADGDTAWADYGYEMEVEATRFDWPSGYVELNKSLNFDDAWQKDFSERKHKDGSIGGAFNLAVSRSGTYTAKVIKELEPDVVASLLDLAEYPGTVFCRRSDGHAFECNADVSIGNREWSMLIDPTITLKRVSLSERYMVRGEDVSGGIIDETGE